MYSVTFARIDIYAWTQNSGASLLCNKCYLTVICVCKSFHDAGFNHGLVHSSLSYFVISIWINLGVSGCSWCRYVIFVCCFCVFLQVVNQSTSMDVRDHYFNPDPRAALLESSSYILGLESDVTTMSYKLSRFVGNSVTATVEYIHSSDNC